MCWQCTFSSIKPCTKDKHNKAISILITSPVCVNTPIMTVHSDAHRVSEVHILIYQAMHQQQRAFNLVHMRHDCAFGVPLRVGLRGPSKENGQNFEFEPSTCAMTAHLAYPSRWYCVDQTRKMVKNLNFKKCPRKPSLHFWSVFTGQNFALDTSPRVSHEVPGKSVINICMYVCIYIYIYSFNLSKSEDI